MCRAIVASQEAAAPVLIGEPPVRAETPRKEVSRWRPYPAPGEPIRSWRRAPRWCPVLKGLSTPWPRLETDQYVMSTGSARPLEDAFRIAQADLVGWLGRDYGLHPLDAYQLLTQAGEAPVANVCDPNYTFVCKLAKRYLPDQAPYQDAHARLRSQARDYARAR